MLRYINKIYIYIYIYIYILGCPESSCRFLVGGVRIDLNISERLKITCVHVVKDGTSGILGKIFDCDMLIFVSFIRL